MRAFHAESEHLRDASADSVARFSRKVKTFVDEHPDAVEDPIYDIILRNIDMASLGFTIVVNDEWEEENYYEF